LRVNERNRLISSTSPRRCRPRDDNHN
jgi:hypothetical protein